MPTIALVPWAGSGTREDPFVPQGLGPEVGIIDLRPNPAVAAGWALASFPEGQALPPGAALLGSSMEETLTAQTKAMVARELGAEFPGVTTVDSLIVAMMLTPPRGKWNRVHADHSGMLRVHLGDWSFAMPEVQAMAHHVENFDQADSTTVGPNWTWTETRGDWRVLSSMLTSPSTDLTTIRGEAVVDSDNMWCEVLWHHANSAETGGTGSGGPMCRFSATAETAYYFELQANTNNYIVGKVVNGVFTHLANAVTPTDVANLAPANNGNPLHKVRLRADGSTLTSFVNMYQADTRTDTSIPAGRRGGVLSYNPGDKALFAEVRISDIRVDRKTSQLEDDFSSGTLAPEKWEFSYLPAPSGLRDGGVYLAYRGDYPGFGSVRHNLVDSFLAVFLKPSDNTAGTSRQDIISLRENDSTNSLVILRDGANLVLRVETGGRRDDTVLTYDPTNHAWMRFRYVGTTAYFDASPDGKAWTSLASKPVSGWVPSNVTLVMQSGDFSGTGAGDNLVAFYDSVNALPLVYASDLAWIAHRQDFNTVKKDRSVDNNPIKIRGTTYAKGLGTHATSDVEVPVPLRAQKFISVIGIDDEAVPAAAGEVVFEIWNADLTSRLYVSPTLNWASDPVTVEIDVKGHKSIRLIVLEGPADTWDHADWADARFESLAAIIFNGAIALAGTVRRSLARVFSGESAATGASTFTRIVLQALSGSLAAAGTMLRTSRKIFAGTTTPARRFVKTAQLRFTTAQLSASGSLDWLPLKIFGGTIAAGGSALITHLGRVLGRAGTAIMRLKPAGEIRMRFRRR